MLTAKKGHRRCCFDFNTERGQLDFVNRVSTCNKPCISKDKMEILFHLKKV